MTLRALAAEGTKILSEAGIDAASHDARSLLLFVAGLDRKAYLLGADGEAEEELCTLYLQALSRRAAHEPLQYITGTAPFYGRDFLVRPGVLIPRFDTEVLIEAVLPYISGCTELLDLCTGSGCILLTLMLEGGAKVRGTGTDLSEEALSVAYDNAQRFGLKPRLLCGDLFAGTTEKYDIITANPPYIPTAEIESLDPEVRLHEPLSALDGEADGLVFYRRIAADAPQYLRDGGILAVEIGYDQGETVPALFEEHFREVRLIRDLAGLPRVVLGIKN